MNRVCPECGKKSEWEIISREEEFNVKGEAILVKMELLKCPECGAEFEDLNSENDPYALAYEEYRKRKGMVFPAQIVDFRKKYNLTQKELSSLLGFGDITLSRYENGSLQDDVHDQLLKFAMEKESLLSLIKQKPDVLPKDKQNDIRSRLEEEITLETTIDNIFNNGMPSDSTGNQVFNLSKVINLIKSFSYPNGVVKSKLLKLLFYVDYFHYKKNNISITGLKYAHLPYGPVPDQYDFLLAAIQQIDKDIHIEIQTYGEYVGEVFKSNKPPKQDVIDEEAKKSVLFVDSFFRGFSAKDIEDFSHDETGYKETVQGEIIPFTFAKDLKI
jgi:putative zinc finger/helix-turn-helix YgiT family protein